LEQYTKTKEKKHKKHIKLSASLLCGCLTLSAHATGSCGVPAAPLHAGLWLGQVCMHVWSSQAEKPTVAWLWVCI